MIVDGFRFELFVPIWKIKCSNVASFLFWLFGNAGEMDSAVSPATGFPQASLV